MANVGVKIDVDYSEINALKDALSEKIEMQIDVDTSKIKSALEDLKDNQKIILDIDDSQAQKVLTNLKTDIMNLQNKANDIRLDLDLSDGSLAGNLKREFNALEDMSRNTARVIDNAFESMDGDSYFDKLRRSAKKMRDGTIDYMQDIRRQTGRFTKSESKFKNGELFSETITKDKRAAIRELAGLAKEYDHIMRQFSMDDILSSDELMSKVGRIEDSFKSLGDTIRREFGGDMGGQFNPKQLNDIADYYEGVRKLANRKLEQSENHKQALGSLKEAHDNYMKADKSEGDIARFYRQQAMDAERRYRTMRNQRDFTEADSDSLDFKEDEYGRQRDINRQLSRLKAQEARLISDQADEYKRLKSEVDDYYDTLQKVARLESVQAAGAISSKDNEKLNRLRQELQLKKQINKQDLDKSNLRDSDREALKGRIDDFDSKVKHSSDIGKIEGDIQAVNRQYKDWEDSIRRVNSLNRQMGNAGDNKADVIRQAIAAENALQDEIRETIRLSNSRNSAREDSIHRMDDEVRRQSEFSEEMRRAGRRDRLTEASMGTAMGRFDYRDMFEEARDAFMYVYDGTKELDDAMIGIKKVVDASDSEIARFEKNIYNAASKYGKTAPEYATSVERWATQGFDLAKAQEYAGLSTIGAFVGGIDEAAMVDYMSVPLKAFGKYGTKPVEILNTMNEVANNTAVEMDFLGEAYKRASATAANAGTSFEELTALMTVAQESTRLGGEIIGTSFRTMDLNISKIARRGTKGFQDKFDFLKGIGVDIVDANGGLRSTFDILTDLSKAWGSLDKITQSTAAFNIAGARGQTALIGLMNDFGRVQEVMDMANSQKGLEVGTGSAYKEFGKQQESLAFKQAKLANTWRETLQTMSGGKGTFTKLMDEASKFLDVFNGFAKTDIGQSSIFGGLKSLLTLFTTGALTKGLGMFSSIFGGAGSGFSQFIEAFKGGAGLFGGLKAGLSSLFKIGNIIPTIGLVVSGFQIIDGLLGGSISKGVGDFIKSFDKVGMEMERYHNARKQLTESISSNRVLNGEIAQAGKLADTYLRAAYTKQQAFEATGNISLLNWDEAEFSDMQTKFNSMIENLDMDHDLKITWNNHEHIMHQLEEFNKELAALASLEAKKGAQDLDSLIRNKPEPGALFEDWKSKNRPDPTGVYKATNMEDLERGYAKGYNDEYYYEDKKNLYKYIAEMMGSQYMKDLENKRAEDLRQADESYKNFQDTLKQTGIGNLGERYRKHFAGNYDQKGYKAHLVRAIKDTGDMADQVNRAADAQSKLNDIQQKIDTGKLTKGTKEYTSALNDWVKEYNDVLSMEGFDDVRSILGGKNIAELTEKEMGQLGNAFSSSVTGAKKSVQEIKDVFRDLIDQYDITDTQLQGLMAGGKKYVQSLREIDSELAATMLFGEHEFSIMAGADALGWDPDTTLKLYQNIQAQADSMAAQTINLPLKFNLVNEDSGLVTGETMSDMIRLHSAMQTVALEVGVEPNFKMDGIGDLEEYLNTIVMSEAEIANLEAEVGIDLKVNEDGTLNVDSIIQALLSDEVTAEQKVKLLTALNVEESSTEEAIQKAESNIKSKTANKEIEAEIGVNLKIGSKTNIVYEGSSGALSAQDYLNATFGSSGDLTADVNVDVIAHAGEVSYEDLFSAIESNLANGTQSTLEAIQEVKLAYQLSEPPSLDQIIQYAGELAKSAGPEAELDFWLKLLPQLQVQDPPESPEEAIKNSVGDPHAEVDGTVDLNVEEGENNGGAVAQGMVNRVRDDIPDSVDAETTVNVTPDIQLSDTNLNEIIMGLEQVGGVEVEVSVLASGEDKLAAIREAIATLPQEQAIAILANVVGEDKAAALYDSLANLDGTQANAQASVEADTSGVSTIESSISALTATTHMIAIGIETGLLILGLGVVKSQLDAINSTNVNPTLNANPGPLLAATAMSGAALLVLGAMVVTPKIDGDNSGFMSAANEVISIKIPDKTVLIKGDASHFHGVMGRLTGKSVTVTINARVNKSKSMAIGKQIGRSFSASVGSAISGRSFSRGLSDLGASGEGGRGDKKEEKPKTIDESVWRYWAKEMFEGLPLQNSLDQLKNAISKNKDNQDELIRLYKKQIQLTAQQIEYTKSLQQEKQNELSSVIEKLTAHGFQASGNKITNLSHAKSFSGDSAGEVETLLNNYKKLYESINDLGQKINDMETDQEETKKDIEEAKEKKELEILEKQFKATEALMRAAENNQSIMDAFTDLVEDDDFELAIKVKSDSAAIASGDIRQLVDEFNRLAKTSVQFEDNADKVYDKMDKLRDMILKNADSIMDYRKEMEELRIDRLTDDFGRFADVVESNSDTIESNIERLMDGLLSGENFEDLSHLETYDMTRKRKLERPYIERLRLEQDLNNKLEEFANAQIDRVSRTATTHLHIEANKYNQLLGMQTNYLNNQQSVATSVAQALSQSTRNVSIDKEYNEWAFSMERMTHAFADRMAKMVTQANSAMERAHTFADKQAIKHKLINDQLDMQIDHYRAIIQKNNEWIRMAEAELRNAELATELRNDLIDKIRDYREENVDAQDKIRDAVESRYEYEFDQMDKAMDNAKEYSDSLSHIFELGDLAKVNEETMVKLAKGVFSGYINEYKVAQSQLRKLLREQSLVDEGSFEWEMITEKIRDVSESVRDLSLQALEANQEVFDRQIEEIKSRFERGLLDNKSLEAWKDYQETWISGIEKELALEKIRQTTHGMENEIINKRLEALDRQDRISRRDLEFLEKQAKVLELEEKIQNINGEKNVQTLVRNADGTWDWGYVSDVSEYDKTSKDLLGAKQNLEEFKNRQRTEYVSKLNTIIERAGNGYYKSPSELRTDLENLNASFKGVMGTNPMIGGMSIDEIVGAYRGYMNDNRLLINDIAGDTELPMDELSNTYGSSTAGQIETAFLNISTEFGRVIGNEIRAILSTMPTLGNVNGNVFHIGTLEFPNATSSDEILRAIQGLPKAAMQAVYSK